MLVMNVFVWNTVTNDCSITVAVVMIITVFAWNLMSYLLGKAGILHLVATLTL
jgi:hypothetical protein